MTQPQLRITRPDELPAPRVDHDSATVLDEAIETLARLRTPTGSATVASDSTPWPACSPTPSSYCPTPSPRPATRS
jgi:hypothetical protein